MAITDYTTQLESVQAAIAAIEAGEQSASWNGRSLTRADLGTMYAREKWLRKMVTKEANGGIRIRGATPG